MSSKNNRVTKANARAYAVKVTVDREKQKEKKRQAKAQRRAATGVATSGVAKKASKKKHTYKIKKGVTIKGIKIVDSDSKKKVLAILKAQQAAAMAIDSDSEWEEDSSVAPMAA